VIDWVNMSFNSKSNRKWKQRPTASNYAQIDRKSSTNYRFKCTKVIVQSFRQLPHIHIYIQCVLSFTSDPPSNKSTIKKTSSRRLLTLRRSYIQHTLHSLPRFQTLKKTRNMVPNNSLDTPRGHQKAGIRPTKSSGEKQGIKVLRQRNWDEDGG